LFAACASAARRQHIHHLSCCRVPVVRRYASMRTVLARRRCRVASGRISVVLLLCYKDMRRDDEWREWLLQQYSTWHERQQRLSCHALSIMSASARAMSAARHVCVISAAARFAVCSSLRYMKAVYALHALSQRHACAIEPRERDMLKKLY